MARTNTERARQSLVAAPPLVFLVVFFLAPAIIMALASLRYPGEFGALAPLVATKPGEEAGLTAENYRLFFSDSIYLEIFVKSFGIAALTTLLCLAGAYPLALLMARSAKRRRDLMVLLCVLPFASNFLVRVYAWMIMLGPFELLFTPIAVICALVYVHLPFMVLPLYTNLERHDPLLLDAAQDLGANAWQCFWRVTFRLSLPGVFAGSALVFIPVLGVFAIPEILGGIGDWLVGNMIKEAFLGVRDWPFGSMLSIMLTLCVLAIAWVTARLARLGGGRA
ncbi:MAG: ABC transporter permease [Betaproteobacteria bacterium]|nr:ABC transporter permease [Betaproteobacteria bacterium]